jgi:predicted DNA-binding antitoxin AbrB/MazE fold protein
MFVEVKKPNGVLSELQKVRIKELKERGINIKIWTDFSIDFVY